MEDYRERALAKLSIAALAIDFILVLAIWKLCREALPAPYGFFKIVATWFWLGLPLGLLLHLFFSEIVLSGWSLGRFCCGLSVAHRNPTSSTVGWRMRRAFVILTRFGLGSLNPNRLPAYNCAEDIVFSSDLAGPAPTRSKVRSTPVPSPSPSSGARTAGPAPVETGRAARRTALPGKLEVIAGPHKGMTAHLVEGRMFPKDGLFRIGRDPAWADLVLSKDARISGRHCFLAARGGQLAVADGNGAGGASTNGTIVDGRRLQGLAPEPVSHNSTISIGDSVIRLV